MFEYQSSTMLTKTTVINQE